MSSVLLLPIASLREFTRACAMPQQVVGIFQSVAGATMWDDRRLVAADDSGTNVTPAVSDRFLACLCVPVSFPTVLAESNHQPATSCMPCICSSPWVAT